MGGAADFFVSYTSTDRAWAEWIAWQLEADGYQVVFQGWDFMAGSDWAHGMQRATTTADRLVVVLSAAYLQSGHGEAEWRSFYAKDPSGEHGLLLPVRVGDVERPGCSGPGSMWTSSGGTPTAPERRYWLRQEECVASRQVSRSSQECPARR